MGFLSDLIESTPGLGHVKGLYHYARGEEKKAKEVIYQCTRTSAVITGGMLAGPAGAIAAGLATDAAASAIMNEEKGIVNSCKNIGKDIAANRNPVVSIASAGLQLGLDGISGYGASSSGAGSASVKKTMQKGGEQVIKKSVKISSAEAAKMVTKKSSEITVKKTAKKAIVISARLGLEAAKKVEDERKQREWEEQERKKESEEKERREREQREREQREREQREREQREREQREREQREREQREREQREREQREREQREREQREREQREREQREREQREREQREREQREREQREREQREREQREREQREREQREREQREREQREREQREREQREREQREREQREREQREREQRERERREREQREREQREREQREREQREREQRERERRERESRERERREREQRERESEERGRRERGDGEKEQKKAKKQEKWEKKMKQRANSEKQKRDTSGLEFESSQPPEDNEDNNEEREQENEKPSIFDTFINNLRKILRIVYGNEEEPFSSIFNNLSTEDREYLVKILKPLMRSGTLEVVIELVIRMFKQHFPQDISFLNFLSLLEFVQTYVTEELLDRTLISRGTQTAETEMKSKERRKKIISEIASETDIIEKITKLFEELKTEIKAEIAAWNTEFPHFRDIFNAVYHYFKHRKVPGSVRILSIKEYYDWIKKFLGELLETKSLTELKDLNVQKYVHEKFVPIFCRRFKIVLKFHGGNTVLSSAYVVIKPHPDDEKIFISEMAQSPINAFIRSILLLCAVIILLNAPLIVSTCITFIAKLLLNTLFFFFDCFSFILTVLLYILLIFIFLALLYFNHRNAR